MEVIDWYTPPNNTYKVWDEHNAASTRGDFMIILKLLKIVEHYETRWVLHG